MNHGVLSVLPLRVMVEYEEAINIAKAAVDRDPVSASLSHTLAVQLALARRFDDAIQECRRTIDLDANFAVAHDVLGGLLAAKGMDREAVAELEKAVALSRGAAMPLASLGYVRARLGDRVDARRILEQRGGIEGSVHASPCLCDRSDRAWREGSGVCVARKGI